MLHIVLQVNSASGPVTRYMLCKVTRFSITAGMFKYLCIAQALMYPKKVITGFAHSIAGPHHILFDAMLQALRGAFRRIFLALLTLIAEAQNDLCCIAQAQISLI